MRVLALALVLAAAACSGRPDMLPAGDGAGPLGGGSGGGMPPSAGPTGTSTSSPAPTMTSSPPPPSPTADAGAETGSEQDSGAGTVADAGSGDGALALDSGGHHDAGADSGTTALAALCVSQVNQIRNQNGAPPLTESSQLDAFAAKAAASDAQSGNVDGYFYQTNGGGVAYTENEYPGSQVDPGGTAEQVLSQGLQGDVQGGTAGLGNILGQFSSMGCGSAKDSGGQWWVTIEFQF